MRLPPPGFLRQGQRRQPRPWTLRAPNGLNVGRNRELAIVREDRLAAHRAERPTREARRERGEAARELRLPLSLALIRANHDSLGT